MVRRTIADNNSAVSVGAGNHPWYPVVTKRATTTAVVEKHQGLERSRCLREMRVAGVGFLNSGLYVVSEPIDLGGLHGDHRATQADGTVLHAPSALPIHRHQRIERSSASVTPNAKPALK